MFNLFKRKPETVAVPGIGTFKVSRLEDEFMLDGKYSIQSLGAIDVSFPTKNKIVSEHQVQMLLSMGDILKGIQELIPNGFSVTTIMVPDKNSSRYDSIDAEIVIQSSREIKSIILKNGQLEEIIDVG